MAPQDDLTAERAAKLAAFELVKKLTDNAGMDPNDRWDKVNLLLAYRQTARQGALREAEKVCRDRAVLLEPSSKRWELNMVSKAKSDEANDLADKLDRLASEGG
ncbi:MAG: hypothetical protein HQL97_10685 [Magnetococcales bacterium]|nr:hypothetical protein [Magnetococcales bacterium]